MTVELTREEAEALLVFLANDTLKGAEKDALEALVASDTELQAELEALRKIRDEMQGEEIAASPGEFGLARLMRDIEHDAQGSRNMGVSHVWRIAAVVTLGLFVLQGMIFFSARDTFYNLAGGGQVVGHVGPTVTVAFQRDASEGDLRAFLINENLTIVDGPTALGLYILALPQDAEVAPVLERLNAAEELVESAWEEE